MLRHGCFGTIHRGETRGTSGDEEILVSAQLYSCFTVTYGSRLVLRLHIFALSLLYVLFVSVAAGKIIMYVLKCFDQQKTKTN